MTKMMSSQEFKPKNISNVFDNYMVYFFDAEDIYSKVEEPSAKFFVNNVEMSNSIYYSSFRILNAAKYLARFSVKDGFEKANNPNDLYKAIDYLVINLTSCHNLKLADIKKQIVDNEIIYEEDMLQIKFNNVLENMVKLVKYIGEDAIKYHIESIFVICNLLYLYFNKGNNEN